MVRPRARGRTAAARGDARLLRLPPDRRGLSSWLSAPAPGFRVSIAHGSLDPVIPETFGREARALIAEAGLEVAYREDPVGHTITPGGLAQANTVLAAGRA